MIIHLTLNLMKSVEVESGAYNNRVYGRVVDGTRLLIWRGEIPVVGSIPTGRAIGLTRLARLINGNWSIPKKQYIVKCQTNEVFAGTCMFWCNGSIPHREWWKGSNP